MTNEGMIKILKFRYNLLLSRGPHNMKIAAKIMRKIRKLETAE